MRAFGIRNQSRRCALFLFLTFVLTEDVFLLPLYSFPPLAFCSLLPFLPGVFRSFVMQNRISIYKQDGMFLLLCFFFRKGEDKKISGFWNTGCTTGDFCFIVYWEILCLLCFVFLFFFSFGIRWKVSWLHILIFFCFYFMKVLFEYYYTCRGAFFHALVNVMLFRMRL